MFAVKLEVIRALLNDTTWLRRLENARTTCEVEKVLRVFALQKGWEVKELIE